MFSIISPSSFFANNLYKRIIPQSLLIGFVWAWFVLGRSLFPWEIDAWLNTNNLDAVQHYSSWILFASDEFRFPLTFTQKIAYPLGSSIIYTDSIPLLAIVFKFIYKVINHDFQYFGIYYWISSSLMFYYTWNLTRKCFKFSSICAFLIALMLMSSPISTIRMSAGHESLSGHWVIIALFYLFLRKDKNAFQLFIYIFILLFITLGIHAYLASFVLIAILAIASNKILYKDRLSAYIVLLNLILLPLHLFLWGYTSAGRVKGDLWSANILALLDSQSLSRFIPSLAKVEPLQWEGFAYLGSGVILMIVCLIFLFLFHHDKRSKIKLLFKEIDTQVIKVILVTLFLVFIYSLGNPIYLGKYRILTWGDSFISYIPIIGFAQDIFRSTGRYMWPINYAIILFLFYLTKKILARRVATILILVVILINMYESNIYTALTANRIFESRNQITSESTTSLSKIIEAKKPSILISYPTFGCPVEPINIYFWISRYKLYTNNFYLARFSKKYIKYNCQELPAFLGINNNTDYRHSNLEEIKIDKNDTVIVLKDRNDRISNLFSKEIYDPINNFYIYY